MPSVPLPRDLLIAAKTGLICAKQQLDKAREDTRCNTQLKARMDWLTDRPDLLRFAGLIEDIPRLEARRKEAQDEFDRNCDLRLDKKTKICPFKDPREIEESINLCKLSLQRLDIHTSASDVSLESLLHNPRLDGAFKTALAELMSARRRAKSQADFEALYPGSAKWHRCYKKAMADEKMRCTEYLSIVERHKRDLESQCRSLESEHIRKLRLDVEAELDEMKATVIEASNELAEAEAALSHQPEIDQHITRRIEEFEAEQTRDAQTAFNTANKAYEATRNEYLSQFRFCLENDFLAARTDDFAPADEQSFRQQLEKTKAEFVCDWASRHTGANLDPEQATAIGSVHGNVLVTARAGSGKTSTLVTRAAFLVKHCRISPDELLLLVFNKKAAEEMRGRLEIMGCDLPHVMTFHALAYAIVHPEEALIYDSPDDAQPMLSRAFQRVLNAFVDQERFGEEIQKVMLGHFRADWENLIQKGLTLSSEEGLAFRRNLCRETLRGEYVKSFGEKAIANFLFEHDIDYKYEGNHWWNGRNYRPDFYDTSGAVWNCDRVLWSLGNPRL